MINAGPFAKSGDEGERNKLGCIQFCKVKDKEKAPSEMCNVCGRHWHYECVAAAYMEGIGTQGWQCQMCRKDTPQKRKQATEGSNARKKKKNGREHIDLTSDDAQVGPSRESVMKQNQSLQNEVKKTIQKNRVLGDKVKKLEAKVKQYDRIEGYRKISQADLEVHRKEKSRSIQKYKKEMDMKKGSYRRWNDEERHLKAMVTELQNGFQDRDIIDCQKTREFRKNLKNSKDIVTKRIPKLEEELRDQEDTHKRAASTYEECRGNKKQKQKEIEELKAKIEKKQRALIDMQMSIQRIDKRMEEAKVKRDGSETLRQKSARLLKKHKEHKEKIEKAEAKWSDFEENTTWKMLTKKPLKQWTPLEVANWFGHLNSGKYMKNYHTFLSFVKKRKITGEFLSELGRSDWTSNGIVETFEDQVYLDNRKTELITASDILCQFKKGFKEGAIEFLDFTNYLVDQGISKIQFTDLYEAMKDTEQKVTIRSMFDWCVKHLDAKKGHTDLASLLAGQSPQKKLPPFKEEYVIEGSKMLRIFQKLSEKGFTQEREQQIQNLHFDFSIFEEVWIRTKCIETALIEAKKEQEVSGWSTLSQVFGFSTQ